MFLYPYPKSHSLEVVLSASSPRHFFHALKIIFLTYRDFSSKETPVNTFVPFKINPDNGAYLLKRSHSWSPLCKLNFVNFGLYPLVCYFWYPVIHKNRLCLDWIQKFLGILLVQSDCCHPRPTDVRSREKGVLYQALPGWIAVSAVADTWCNRLIKSPNFEPALLDSSSSCEAH